MTVVWRITERCNLSCGFCAYDRTHELGRPRRDVAAAEVRRFGAVLAEYQRATGDGVLLSWLGGEPLLWRELPAIETRLAGELGLRLSVTTNGTTLSRPGEIERLRAHYTEFTVSVDALGERHDALRGEPGLLERLRQGTAALAAAKRRAGTGPKLRANVVLMRGTIGGFAELCAELAEWGIEEITFNQLGGNDRPEFHARQSLGAEQLVRFAAELPALRRLLAERGVVLLGTAGYLARLDASARGEPRAVADCGPGQRFLFIDEVGRVAPCSFTPPTLGVPLTELRTAADVVSLPARFAAARGARPLAECGNCLSTQVHGKFAS